VVVVGGGVAGTTLAWALARRRVPCVLCERGRIGAQGASSVPAALLNPHRGRSARADPQDILGLRAFWTLVDRLTADGLDSGATRGGVLRVAPNARRATAWRALEGTRWLEPAAVGAPYHAPYGALLVPDGGWVRPSTLLSAVAHAARAAGADVRENLAVRAVRPGPIVVTDADTIDARHVVLCIGADDGPGLPLPPLRRIAGEVVTLRLADTPAWPLAGGVYAAFGGGRAWLGGNHREAARPDPGAADALQRALAWSLPVAADAPRIDVWSGVRARGASPRPIVTAIARGVSYYGALAGRGFLCAADLSEALATRLASAEPA
jgi:glycine/D-amino acid oxidase-like deaminating enzyme